MKKRIIQSLLIVSIILIVVVGCVTPSPPQTALTVAELLDLGERFLLDLEFEQALVQFLRVIEIEPMNPRGYTGAAEAHIGLGQIDEAIAILKLGQERLPDNAEIRDMLEGLLQSEAEQESELTQEYYDEPEDVDEPDAYIPVWELFSDEQRDMLTRLEIAAIEFDYKTAYAIVHSAEFTRIFDEFSERFERRNGPGSYWLPYGLDARWSRVLMRDGLHKRFDLNLGETVIHVVPITWDDNGVIFNSVQINHRPLDMKNGDTEFIQYAPGSSWHHRVGTLDDGQFHGAKTITNLLTGHTNVSQHP